MNKIFVRSDRAEGTILAHVQNSKSTHQNFNVYKVTPSSMRRIRDTCSVQILLSEPDDNNIVLVQYQRPTPTETEGTR